MSTFGIWFFGLLGSALLGGLIGGGMYPPPRTMLLFPGGSMEGMIGGMCLFASLRLWFKK